MKKTLNKKLMLDILLTVVLLTLFSKNFFGLFYHEVVGLAVLLPILIHILLNLKIIRGMCKNFRKASMNLKACLIVDALLLLTFLWMGISGILISKTIFTGISTTNRLVKIFHMSLGGWSVILLGIHIVLHICRKEMKTGIAVLLTILAFAAGIYGITNSEITRWMSMPFVTVAGSHFTELKEPEVGKEFRHDQQQGSGQGEYSGKGPGKGLGKGQGKGLGRGEGHGKGEISPLKKISVFMQFSGMMFSSVMATYWIFRWRKSI